MPKLGGVLINCAIKTGYSYSKNRYNDGSDQEETGKKMKNN